MRNFVALVIAAATAGCAVQVTDGDGRAQSLGQWVESLKELPKTPAEAQAQAEARRTASNAAAGNKDQQLAGSGIADAVRPVAVPVGAPGRSNAAWPADKGCRVADAFATRLDVDTVYARAMKRYGFVSADQVALKRQYDRYYMADEGYKHEKQPGAYYRLAQHVEASGSPGGRQSMWLELEISKEPGGSLVEAKYCIASRDPSVGTVGFHQGLQRRLREDLGQ